MIDRQLRLRDEALDVVHLSALVRRSNFICENELSMRQPVVELRFQVRLFYLAEIRAPIHFAHCVAEHRLACARRAVNEQGIAELHARIFSIDTRATAPPTCAFLFQRRRKSGPALRETVLRQQRFLRGAAAPQPFQRFDEPSPKSARRALSARG